MPRSRNAMRRITGLAERLVRALRRHGVRGTARRVRSRARNAVYLDETHIWYSLEIGTELPRELPPGCELRSDRGGDAAPAGPLGEPASAAEARFSAGGERWRVREGSEVAFRCWTFPSLAPMIAASGGWLELPPGVVCLEDSATAPAHRGRGIAPAVWSAIARSLAGRPQVRTMVTKVEEENLASRKAVEKSGFREIGVMQMRRAGPRARVRFDPFPGESVAAALAERLSR